MAGKFMANGVSSAPFPASPIWEGRNNTGHHVTNCVRDGKIGDTGAGRVSSDRETREKVFFLPTKLLQITAGMKYFPGQAYLEADTILHPLINQKAAIICTVASLGAAPFKDAHPTTTFQMPSATPCPKPPTAFIQV